MKKLTPILILLIGCTPEPIIQDMEQVTIYRDKPNIILYSDLSDPERMNVELDNTTASPYTWLESKGQIYLRANKEIKSVKHIGQGYLEIKNNSVTFEPVGDINTLRIEL